MNDRLNKLNESSAVVLDAKVSPALHPDSISPQGAVLVDENGGPGETAYAACRSALRTMYSALSEIEAAHRAQLVPASGPKGPTKMVVPAERRAALSDAMARRFEGVADTHARSEAVIHESIGQLEQRIGNAVAHPNRERASVVQVASEIRAHTKGMGTAGERMAFLQNAIAEGDIEVTAAVLGSSCWVSGLDKKEFAVLKDAAERRFAPRETAQRDAAEKVKAALLAASHTFTGRYMELLPAIRPSAADQAIKKLREA
jgi:hypothetical protein